MGYLRIVGDTTVSGTFQNEKLSNQNSDSDSLKKNHFCYFCAGLALS